MDRYPAVRLCDLREIGWREWNPLGLPPPKEDTWRHANIAEYDNHMLHIACLLKKGGGTRDAVAYLVAAAAEYRGDHEDRQEDSIAAERAVQAVARYLNPGGPDTAAGA